MKSKIFNSIAKIMAITMLITSLSVCAYASESVATKNANVKYQNSSLNIQIKNIDMASIHDTNPLDKCLIEELKLRGYTDKEIQRMDYGDYKKVWAKWDMSKERIEIAKNIYPELTEVDLTKWTNEDYETYIRKRNDELFKPTTEEAQQLKKRGLEPKDARHLLKEFHTYKNILDQSDEVIKENLEAYYQTKIDYVNSLNQIEIENKNIIYYATDIPLPDYLKGTTYRWVDTFPYYVENGDWYHEDSQTHIPSIRDQYANLTPGIFYAAYGTSYTPRYTNLWGTYSRSQGGAHEGLDFHPQPASNPPLNLPVIGGGTIISKSTGKLVVLANPSGVEEISVFFLHMSNIQGSVGEYISEGTYIGNEDEIGGNTTGEHLHIGVHKGYTTTTVYENDHTLDSDNPYYLRIS